MPLKDIPYTGYQCEPQLPMYEDGFTDWISPKPTGYLMQCCDCNLIHEVNFRVAKYEPRPSESYEVVIDADMQAQLQMKRRDDLAGTKENFETEPVGFVVMERQPLTDEDLDLMCEKAFFCRISFQQFARSIEAAHGIKRNVSL